MYLILILYPKLVSTALTFFDCSSVNGRYLLASDEKMPCYESKWFQLLPLIVFIILGYCIGIIVGLVRLLLHLRKSYDAKLLFKSGPALHSFYNFTGYLCQRFHPLHYHYEFILLTRKVVILIIGTLLKNYSQSRVLATSLTFYVAGNVHLHKEPFRTSELNRLEGVLIGIVLLQCVCSLLLEAANPSLHGGSTPLQRFNTVFSYFSFYSVVFIGGMYALYTWLQTVRRKDGGRGNESSSLAIDRTMGRKYRLGLNTLYLVCTVLVMVLLAVCQSLEPSTKGVKVELIVGASCFVIVTVVTLLVKRQSNRVQGLHGAEDYTKILEAGEKLSKAKPGAEYEKIKLELLSPLYDKCRSCEEPMLDDDSVGILKTILEPLRQEYNVMVPIDLLCALQYSNEILTQCLSDPSTDVNSTVSGYPAVHHAFYQRNREMLTLLVNHQADLYTTEDLNGRSLASYSLHLREASREVMSGEGEDVNSVDLEKDPVIWLYCVLRDALPEEKLLVFERHVLMKEFFTLCESLPFPVFPPQDEVVQRLQGDMERYIDVGVDVNYAILVCLGLIDEDAAAASEDLDFTMEVSPGFTPLLITVCARRWKLATRMIELNVNTVTNPSSSGVSLVGCLPHLDLTDEEFDSFVSSVVKPWSLSRGDGKRTMELCNDIVLHEIHYRIVEQGACVPVVPPDLSAVILSRWTVFERTLPDFDPTLIGDSVAAVCGLPVRYIESPSSVPCRYPALHVAAMQEKWKVMGDLMRSGKYSVFSSEDFMSRSVFQVLPIKSVVFLAEGLVSGKLIQPQDVRGRLLHIVNSVVRARVKWEPVVCSLTDVYASEVKEVITRWKLPLSSLPPDTLCALRYPVKDIARVFQSSLPAGDVRAFFQGFFELRVGTGLPACHHVMASGSEEYRRHFKELVDAKAEETEYANAVLEYKLEEMSKGLHESTQDGTVSVMQFVVVHCPSFKTGRYTLTEREREAVWGFMKGRKPPLSYIDLHVDVACLIGCTYEQLEMLITLKGQIHGDSLGPPEPVSGFTALEIALMRQDEDLVRFLLPLYNKYCSEAHHYDQAMKLLTPYGPFDCDLFLQLSREKMGGGMFIAKFLEEDVLTRLVFRGGGRIRNYNPATPDTRLFDPMVFVNEALERYSSQ